MQVKPLVAGIAIGLIPSVIIGVTSLTGSSLIDDSPKFLLQPIAEHYEPEWDLSFMNYEGGVLSNKTERFYQRGKDWIIIKDFPLIIDDYQSHYKDISDDLWSK
jgi:hypothetical protein